MFKKFLKSFAPAVLALLVSFPMVKVQDGTVVNFDNVLYCKQLSRGRVRCVTAGIERVTYFDLHFDNSDLAANEFMAQYEEWLISKGKH